ncbi:MAG: ATP-binding protein, partial [Chloroflexota bacterium]|nr:ATP-binding protein [Chloroflexota bacterium]
IDAHRHGGATWCVPLWGERGLIGLLLLGDKRDGGLYTEEEIELARATGERLIDARATAELARRLLLLQRRRLAEDQVLDGRARRALHDDVLPLLHAAILTLSSRPAQRPVPSAVAVGEPSGTNGAALGSVEPGSSGVRADAVALLIDAHRQIGGLLRELPSALGPELARQGLIGALHRTIDDLADGFDAVDWRIDPAAERAAAMLSPLVAEVLFGAAREAIRNAARHARAGDPSRPLHLTVAAVVRDGLELRIEDDGVGLRPVHANAAEPNGATRGGQGLLLHSTLLATLGGALLTESAPGVYTRVILRVPTES